MPSQILRIKRKISEEPLKALKVGKRRKIDDNKSDDTDECVFQLLTSLQEKDCDVTIKLNKAIKRKVDDSNSKVENTINCSIRKKQKQDISLENLSVGVLHGEADKQDNNINWNTYKQMEKENKITCNGVEMKRETTKSEFVYDYYTIDRTVAPKIDLTELLYVKPYE